MLRNKKNSIIYNLQKIVSEIASNPSMFISPDVYNFSECIQALQNIENYEVVSGDEVNLLLSGKRIIIVDTHSESNLLGRFTKLIMEAIAKQIEKYTTREEKICILSNVINYMETQKINAY